MPDRGDWSDDRLSRFEARVEKQINGLPAAVAALTTAVEYLGREFAELKQEMGDREKESRDTTTAREGMSAGKWVAVVGAGALILSSLIGAVAQLAQL